MNLSQTTPKLTFLFKVIFYKRIAARTRLQTVYNVVLGVLAVTWAVIFFDIIFQCYPIDRKWTTDPNSKRTPNS